jgi:transcriptional regulator of acetoin/glycerol metabolism
MADDEWHPSDDHDDVARARELFLEREPDVWGVRKLIKASWERSREAGLAADEIHAPYVDGHESRSPLARCAGPILDALHEQLQFEPVSIVLTDNSGVVIDRRVTAHDLAVRLDAVSLAAGFSYAEEHVGTNGIGTAISSGRATFVDGREHYTGQLGQFACAGVPIHHPTRGSVLGILDLTSYAHSPGPMLMALAQSTARHIESALMVQTGAREAALFREYLMCSHRYGGPVLAVNTDVVMMNERLRTVLDGSDQQALIAYAGECLSDMTGRGLTRTVELPSGRSAQMHGAPVLGDAGPAGWLFRIRATQPELTRPATLSGRRHPRGGKPLPGAVGSSAAWLRCIDQVSVCHDAGDWVALTGEPGSGKRTLLRAVHLDRCPGSAVLTLDPPAEGEFDSWLASIRTTARLPGSLVVLTRMDRVDPDFAAALVCELSELQDSDAAPAERPRLAVTLNSAAGDIGPLAAAFPRTIDVPALRHHLDDLPELVAHLLGQLSNEHSGLEMSAQALSQLRRLDWPGNVSELKQVLAAVVRRRRSGVIEVADLPPSARTAKHRMLTQIESIERDAIVEAMLANGENATRSAAALGISRATIYRKFRQYGISVPLPR